MGGRQGHGKAAALVTKTSALVSNCRRFGLPGPWETGIPMGAGGWPSAPGLQPLSPPKASAGGAGGTMRPAGFLHPFGALEPAPKKTESEDKCSYSCIIEWFLEG